MTRPQLSIYRRLLKLGLPVLVTQLGSIVVSMADTMMVGSYGTHELAAAAFVNNIFMIPLVMQFGFAAGVTPIVGAFYGAKDNHGVGAALRMGIKLNLILAAFIILFMGGFYFALPHLGQPPEILALAQQYYLIVLASVVLGSLFLPAMQTAMGVTDTVTPMLVIIGGNLVNVLGNYLLIFGHFGCPQWGLNGAGTSTVLARLLCSAVMLAIVFRGKRYRPFRQGACAPAKDKTLSRKMRRTAVPLMIQGGIECSLWSLGAIVCGWYGKEQLAAYQVVLVMGQLGFMTYMSFATAVSIRVSNLMGNKDVRQIRSTTIAGLHLNLLLATAACLTFFLFGDELLHLFTPDERVITIGLTLILPLILYQVADAVQITYINALRGTAYVRPLIPISLLSYIVIGAGTMMLLAEGMDLGARGVYLSFSIALVAAAVLYRRSLVTKLFPKTDK